MTTSDDGLSEAAKEAADRLWLEIKGVEGNLKDPFRVPKAKSDKVVPMKKTKRGRPLPDGMSPVTAYVRSLDGDYKTTQEVADVLQMSSQWVRKMSKEPTLKAPSFIAPFGRLKIFLYTPEDIEELRGYIKAQHTVIPREEYESG